MVPLGPGKIVFCLMLIVCLAFQLLLLDEHVNIKTKSYTVVTLYSICIVYGSTYVAFMVEPVDDIGLPLFKGVLIVGDVSIPAGHSLGVSKTVVHKPEPVKDLR